MTAHKRPLTPARAPRDFGFGVLAIIVVAVASLLGQIATFPNLAPWYAGLVKPSFNPPNWVFAIWNLNS